MVIKKIKQIISMFENSKLSEMEVEFEDIKLSLKKPQVSSNVNIQTIPNNLPTEDKNIHYEEKEKGEWITSPLVGTFYRAASPTSDPFVAVNQEVVVGDVICVIEAMKVMNEIKSTVSGVVKEIAVDNEQLVEFDQQLIRIEKHD